MGQSCETAWQGRSLQTSIPISTWRKPTILHWKLCSVSVFIAVLISKLQNPRETRQGDQSFLEKCTIIFRSWTILEFKAQQLLDNLMQNSFKRKLEWYQWKYLSVPNWKVTLCWLHIKLIWFHPRPQTSLTQKSTLKHVVSYKCCMKPSRLKLWPSANLS